MPRRDEDGDARARGPPGSCFGTRRPRGSGCSANALRDVGVHHRYLDVPRGEPLPKDLRGVGGLIVLGGPMGAYETDSYPFLKTESAPASRRRIAAGRPVLGICLGAQLIAQVLGARVYPGERREVGWAPVTLTDDGRDDPLFVGGWTTALTVFHLHGDTYELPPDARATSRARDSTSSRRSAGATWSTGSSSTSSSPSRSSHGC